jgi:hypothetical protein
MIEPTLSKSREIDNGDMIVCKILAITPRKAQSEKYVIQAIFACVNITNDCKSDGDGRG